MSKLMRNKEIIVCKCLLCEHSFIAAAAQTMPRCPKCANTKEESIIFENEVFDEEEKESSSD